MWSSTLHFNGQVAIVTGAGNGLGRDYAKYLAKHGAKVVVNDLGTSHTGDGTTTSAADQVVKEIQEEGGIAVANYDSVEFGEKVVQTAVDTWGRVDIVINNAGILRDISLAKMTDKDWDLIYRVHVKGTYSVTKAAWGIMREQRYGRIVNVASAAGLYGNFGQTNYSSAKLGIAGFSLAAAKEGASRNIKVNVIAPLAWSRMTATVMPSDMSEKLKPEFVSPFVGYLCHETCDPSGSIYEVGACWVAKVRWQRARGCFFLPSDLTMDAIAEKIDEIEDFTTDPSYPTASSEVFGSLMPHMSKL